jgi:7-cyano-7-deazaguanine tRNA-ribosyltransferase
MVFALAILLGCDMFDSASYAKFARDGRMMFPEGTKHLADMRGLDCECPACRDHTLDSLNALPEEERSKVLAAHNLFVSQREIKVAKHAMLEGELWELVERRCRAHPALIDALRRLKEHRDFLERYEPLSRDGAFFYTGPESMWRPAAHRYQKRYFERYQQPSNKVCVAFEEGERPYGRVYAGTMAEISKVADAHFMVVSPFGPVPIELDEMYPLAQSVFPKAMDLETQARTKELMERFSHGQEYGICLLYDGHQTVDTLATLDGSPSSFDIDLARVRAVADYQFGKGAATLLLDGKVGLVKSKNNDRIRNVLVDGEHILSMRAPDGFFTLRPAGARRLRKGFPSPQLRVIVHADSVEFNRAGKNVFCQFVQDCDPDLVPMDEVMVVDEKDELVAIGRALLVKEEMCALRKGLAVKVREGVRV